MDVRNGCLCDGTNIVTNGQSYKHFTLVNYDSRLVITSKLLILTTLES